MNVLRIMYDIMSSFSFVLTAENGGRLFALSYMNLTKAGTPASAFEQMFISSWRQTTLVSISIPQINHYEVISLDSSNNWRYTKDIMQDISVPSDVSQRLVTLTANSGQVRSGQGSS